MPPTGPAGKTPLRVAAWLAGGLLVLGAGLATATLLWKGRRDVTTRSDAAYASYLAGLDAEGKLYHKDALAAFGRAVEQDPSFVMAKLHLAQELYGRDLEASGKLIEDANRLRNEVSSHERLWIDFFVARKAEITAPPAQRSELHKKSAEAFDRILQSDEEDLWALKYMIKQGDPRETGPFDPVAFDARCLKLLALDPNEVSAFNTLGYSAGRQGNAEKAEEYFRRYRFVAPDQANPHDSLGELYAAQGRYEEAAESLQRSLTIKPDFWNSLAILGLVHLGKGEPLKAAEYYLEADRMADDPGSKLEMRAHAARALAVAGDVDRAFGIVGSFRSLAPAGNGIQGMVFARRVKNLTTLVQLRAGLLPEAREGIRDLETWLASDAGQLIGDRRKGIEGTLKGMKAEEATLSGRYEEALPFFADLLSEQERLLEAERYPRSKELRILWARALSETGRRPEAARVLDEAEGFNPRFAPVLAAREDLCLPKASSKE